MQPSSMTRSPFSGLRPVVSVSRKIWRMGVIVAAVGPGARSGTELGEAFARVVDVFRVRIGGGEIAREGRPGLARVALALERDAEPVVDRQRLVAGQLGDGGVPLLLVGQG